MTHIKVIVVSYVFPPSPGIGGRRWAKFSKYLSKNSNLELKVIAADNQLNQKSNWLSDLKGIKGEIQYLKSGYPKYLGIPSNTFVKKILYRLSKWYCMVKVRGNYYDRSAHWHKRVGRSLENDISNGFNNIIVTCAPFIHAYHLLGIKKKYPHVNFIVDFRDPWTDIKTSYGFDSLSKSRQNFEAEAEKKVILNSDFVISVSKEMNDYFINLDPQLKNQSEKFKTIPNGFDLEDFPSIKESTNQHKLRLILAGTFYNESIHLLTELVEALNQIKNESPHLYQLMQFDFYGNVPTTFHSITQNHENICYQGKTSLSNMYIEISRSNLGMLFLMDQGNYSLSTKFYEYIALQKPVACFALQGNTIEFIEKNNIGYGLPKGNIKEALMRIVDDFTKNQLRSTKNFDLKTYDVKYLSQHFIEILKPDEAVNLV